MIKRVQRSGRPVGEGRPRIDPRAVEMPEPQSAPAGEAPALSAAARPRIDPHEARSRRRVARHDDGLGRRQLPIGGDGAGPAASGAPADAPVRVEMPAGYVLVASFEDEPWSDAERELLGAARALADKEACTALMLVRIDQASAPCDAAANGVDRLVNLSTVAQPDRAAAAILSLVQTYAPRHLVFAEAPVDGDIARRVAAELGERPAVAVRKLAGGVATGRCDGGRQDLSRPVPRILLLASGTGDFVASGPPREARALPAPSVSPTGLIDLGPEPMDASTVPLDQAAFIVSAGEGVTDWQGFRDLAGILSAAIGGSRQVCDAGHLPRNRQVGASGTLVSAKCYLAFGISGAPQHLQGVARCRRILAVNTDLHAAMVKCADLSIIADAQAVIPALAELVLERRRAG